MNDTIVTRVGIFVVTYSFVYLVLAIAVGLPARIVGFQVPPWAGAALQIGVTIGAFIMVRRTMKARGWLTKRDDSTAANAEPQPGASPLAVLRFVFLIVTLAMLSILYVLVIALPWGWGEQVTPIGWALVAAGLLGVLGAVWARRREIPCGDREHLKKAYTQRVFWGLAAAENPALLAFVAAFVAEAAWLYLIGLGLSALGFWLVAPTSADVERKASELQSSGCSSSLHEALAAET